MTNAIRAFIDRAWQYVRSAYAEVAAELDRKPTLGPDDPCPVCGREDCLCW